MAIHQEADRRLGEDRLAKARETGRREADALDLRLRCVEGREREDRLTRLVAERSDLSVAPLRSSLLEAERVERLERELGQVLMYQRAILRSRGWRLAQAARRLIGRAW